MNADAPAPAKGVNFLHRAFLFFHRETGQSLLPWLVVALCSFVAQIVFRRELAPGEFGTLNTALGVVSLFAVPVLALTQALASYLAQNHAPDRQERFAALRAATPFLTETAALIWAALALPLLFLLLPLLDLPRFSLDLFTLLNVFVALGALVGVTVCQANLRLWGWLLAASALTRIVVGAGIAGSEPWAESALAAFLLAGLITLIPALRPHEVERDWRKAWQAVCDRDFLLRLAATFSVVLAIFLFTSADRIVAQSWFGSPSANNTGFVKDYVNWPLFDGYQTAGLLGRALLWGAQPLLLLLFAQRARLDRTTSASLKFFWIYLGVLVAGAIFLTLLAQPLSRLFCGAGFEATVFFIPGFALAMVPLGLLQGVGMFALASRRFPECFTLGGGSVVYAIALYLVGRQPQLMLTYMFGGGLMALMAVLFVGVVRWGRKQP